MSSKVVFEGSGSAPANQSDRTPFLGSPAFACPHCSAFAQQRWFTLNAEVPENPPQPHDLPFLRGLLADARAAQQRGDDPNFPLVSMETYLSTLEAGLPYVERSSQGFYVYWSVSNVHLSSCFVCEKVAVWVDGRVRFPAANAEVAEANSDLPADIRRDYAEAAEVALASPRAAAALLRLAIQKLCSHLVERDGDINEMIGELVKRGLNPLIQQALDVVRVIGNEAVHPGELNLRDDKMTATQLFGLVNLIAEAMITQPKHVMALYGSLPPTKLAGIEQRNAKARQGKQET